MNWLDLVLGAIILLHLVNGFGSGMFKILFDLVIFLVVFILALLGSRLMSGFFAQFIDPESIADQYEMMQALGVEVALEDAPRLIAGLIALLVLFVLLSLLFRLFSRGFHWINRIPVIGLFNRLGGSVMGAAIGAAFVYVIIVVMSLIPVQLFISALEDSEIVVYAEQYLSFYALELKNFLINFYTLA